LFPHLHLGEATSRHRDMKIDRRAAAPPELASTQVPRLPGLPWIGPPALFTSSVRFVMDARQKGEVVHARVFGIDMFLVYSPQLAEHVLIKNQRNYRKDRYVRRAGRVFGNGLLRAEGELWRQQRRLIQPSFHKQRVRGYAETMLALTEAALGALAPGSEVDFHALISSLTAEIAVQTMFGQSANVDAGAVGAHLAVIMKRFEAVGYLIEPDWWPSPSQLRYRRAITALDRMLERYVEIRRAAPGDDVLSALLEMRDESGAPLGERQIRDELTTLFIAGHETTSLTLVFSWRLLALHPEIASALRREVCAVPRVDLESLPGLTLLDQVIKESLRLFPPAYSIPREAVAADSLGGCPISPGDQVLIGVVALHRDPRYFAEPETFLPQRWTKEFEAQLPRCAYFPFGGGPRMCVGAAFAELEAKLVLGTLIRRFKPSLLSDAPLELVSSFTQRPRYGLPVRLETWG
jgi:cytochrome P450